VSAKGHKFLLLRHGDGVAAPRMLGHLPAVLVVVYSTYVTGPLFTAIFFIFLGCFFSFHFVFTPVFRSFVTVPVSNRRVIAVFVAV